MLGFVTAHIPWNAITNLELKSSYNALQSDSVLPFASMWSMIWLREYALTVEAFKKQSLSRNKVSSALHVWTLKNKLAILSVIADYLDRNWALREVQIAFDEVNGLLFPSFKSQSRIISQGSIY